MDRSALVFGFVGYRYRLHDMVSSRTRRPFHTHTHTLVRAIVVLLLRLLALLLVVVVLLPPCPFHPLLMTPMVLHRPLLQ